MEDEQRKCGIAYPDKPNESSKGLNQGEVTDLYVDDNGQYSATLQQKHQSETTLPKKDMLQNKERSTPNPTDDEKLLQAFGCFKLNNSTEEQNQGRIKSCYADNTSQHPARQGLSVIDEKLGLPGARSSIGSPNEPLPQASDTEKSCKNDLFIPTDGKKPLQILDCFKSNEDTEEQSQGRIKNCYVVDNNSQYPARQGPSMIEEKLGLPEAQSSIGSPNEPLPQASDTEKSCKNDLFIPTDGKKPLQILDCFKSNEDTEEQSQGRNKNCYVVDNNSQYPARQGPSMIEGKSRLPETQSSSGPPNESLPQASDTENSRKNDLFNPTDGKKPLQILECLKPNEDTEEQSQVRIKSCYVDNNSQYPARQGSSMIEEKSGVPEAQASSGPPNELLFQASDTEKSCKNNRGKKPFQTFEYSKSNDDTEEQSQERIKSCYVDKTSQYLAKRGSSMVDEKSGLPGVPWSNWSSNEPLPQVSRTEKSCKNYHFNPTDGKKPLHTFKCFQTNNDIEEQTQGRIKSCYVDKTSQYSVRQGPSMIDEKLELPGVQWSSWPSNESLFQASGTGKSCKADNVPLESTSYFSNLCRESFGSLCTAPPFGVENQWGMVYPPHMLNPRQKAEFEEYITRPSVPCELPEPVPPYEIFWCRRRNPPDLAKKFPQESKPFGYYFKKDED